MPSLEAFVKDLRHSLRMFRQSRRSSTGRRAIRSPIVSRSAAASCASSRMNRRAAGRLATGPPRQPRRSDHRAQIRV